MYDTPATYTVDDCIKIIACYRAAEKYFKDKIALFTDNGHLYLNREYTNYCQALRWIYEGWNSSAIFRPDSDRGKLPMQPPLSSFLNREGLNSKYIFHPLPFFVGETDENGKPFPFSEPGGELARAQRAESEQEARLHPEPEPEPAPIYKARFTLSPEAIADRKARKIKEAEREQLQEQRLYEKFRLEYSLGGGSDQIPWNNSRVD